MRSALFAAALAGVGASAAAQQPEVASVERGPFVVTLDRAGTFWQSDPVVLRYRPEADTQTAEVVESVRPGPVERGQVLIRLRSDTLDQRIDAMTLDLAADRARLELRQAAGRYAEDQQRLRQVRAVLQLADAQRALRRFSTIDAAQRLQSSENRVRDLEVTRREQEELFRVRVRMYEADGILEKAETMDIARNKRGLDRSLARQPNVRVRHRILKQFTLPQEVAALELAVRRAKHALDMLKATSQLQLAQERLALQKQELAFARKERELDRWKRDRDGLVIRAPTDGHAFAGHYDGRWSDVAARRLRPGSRISPDTVLFTIVQSAPKLVRTTVPEAMRWAVAAGQEATLVPTAVPEVTLPASVERVATFAANGEHEVWLRARTRHERLFPGSTCRVRITLRDNPAALTVPATAIRWRPGAKEVDVWKDGAVMRRVVEVGLTSGGRTEILAGVEVGEKVLRKGR